MDLGSIPLSSYPGTGGWGGGGGGGVGGSWRGRGLVLPDHAVATTDVRTKNKVLNTAERISKNHLLMNTMGSIHYTG